MRYGMYYGYDWTYILVLIGMILSLAASFHVKSTYKKYSKVQSCSRMTGAQVAERILRNSGINDVAVKHVSGDLTDHYNPSTKELCLSDTVYGSTSVAALGVAAHECGHAIQHEEQYAPLSVRAAILPAANIGASLSWIIFAAGLVFSITPLLTIGIVLFSMAVLFQLVTLPVEFNASRRALAILKTTGILGNDETNAAAKVLKAAALTYVAALAASILQLLRLIVLAGGRRRD